MDPQDPQASDSRFLRRALSACAIAVALAALAWSLAYVAHVLLAVFAGVLLGIFLAHLTWYVSRYTKVGYGWSFALVLAAFLGLTVAGAALLGARIVDQFQELSKELPSSLAEVQTRLKSYSWGRPLLDYWSSAQSQLTGGAGVVRRVSSYASATMGALVNSVVILFIGIYVAYNPELYARGLARLFPPARRQRAGQVLNALGMTLWRWVLGRLMSMAIVWVLTSLGLWALGMPLALTLGFLAGLLNFVPNIGPIISVVPAALLAIPQGAAQVLYVVLLYSAIQAVESYLITPQVQERMVSLPPALIISAQVLLGVLFGFMGLLLATPIAAAGLVLVRMLYLEDILGERVEA